MDVQISIQRFIKDRQALDVSPRHLQQLQYKLRNFGDFLANRGVQSTAQIDNEVINDYLLTYINPGNGRRYSDWYIRGIATVVRAYLRYLAEMRIIRNPIKFKMPRFHRPQPKIVEANEMQEIIDQVDDPKIKLLLLFFYDTGLRLEEDCATLFL